MSSANSAILWGFALFLLYILVPMIPAILIYKKFPDEKISAEGFLGKLKINATGAFAGYLIILLVGHFMIPQIQKLIDLASEEDNTPWIIKSKVAFVQKKTGEPIDRITDDSVKEHLVITYSPDYFQKKLNSISFSVKFKKEDETKYLSFSYPGFKPYVVDFADPAVHIQSTKKLIDLGTIKLEATGQEYKPENFPALPDSVNLSTGPPTIK